jgi:hypothetical protein
MAALCAAAGASKYIVVFTKVSWFDMTKSVPGGTGGRYRRAPLVPVLIKTTRISSSTQVDFWVLATILP